VQVTAADLVAVPAGTITEQGLRHNVRVGVQYLEAWLGGNGCVPLYHLMEDAATAEISRTQVWQWLRHGARFADGRPITADLYATLRDDEIGKLRPHGSATFDLAARLFDELSTAPTLAEFLTLPAYDHLLSLE
jgi:malate synthase